MKPKQFHLLARAVICADGYLLVAHEIGKDYTFLPGGHVELGESIEETFRRELREEMDVTSEMWRYIGGLENDYETPDAHHFEISHLFEVRVGMTPQKNPVSQEPHLEFYWVPVDKLEEHNLMPLPLRAFIPQYVAGYNGAWWGSTLRKGH